MNYSEMKKKYIQGWHAWNVYNVLSHVYMPEGLALNLAFKDNRDGRYLRETQFGRDENEIAIPGLHAFDDSYTDVTLHWQDMQIHIESTVDEDDILLLVTPVKLQKYCVPTLVVEAAYLWNRPGYTVLQDSVIVSHSKDITHIIRTTGVLTRELSIPIQTASFQIVLSEPVAVYTGKERSLEYIGQKIAEARQKTLKNSEQYGELAGLYQAMECTLGWDTVYEAMKDRVFSPVSRLWSIGAGGYVLFCWDNFFAGFMSGIGNKYLGYSNMMEILNERTPQGFVPNFSQGTGLKSADRSQPPVGSTMLLENYRRHREKWIVEEMYPALLEWNKWYMDNRMNESGALCWGSNEITVIYGHSAELNGVHDRLGAALESGLDDSPMYDDIPFNKEKNRLELEDVGLTGLYIRDCRSLIELAHEIGRDADIPELQERMQRAEHGLEGLWDEENGFYYNRRTDTGEFSRRISPTNFYALFSSCISKERARRIADEHYYNPEEFYGEWMLPSIARNDPAYPEQNYWRGRVWAPTNFLVYLALCGTELDDVRKDLAEKSKKIFLNEWNMHRHVHENYNAITGEGCDVVNSDKFHHWGALLSVIALADAGYIPDFGKALTDRLGNKTVEQ